MNSIQNYINEALGELRHVRWPTRQQSVRFSAVVLAFSAICSVVFGLIDIGLSELVKMLLSLSA